VLASPAPVAAAFVLTTAGSTGRPDCVVVPHSAVATLAAARRAMLGADPAGRLLLTPSAGPGAAICELVLALSSGAALVVADPDQPVGDQLTRAAAGAATLTPPSPAR
jgi:non-ribosomal peptide synthetase component F